MTPPAQPVSIDVPPSVVGGWFSLPGSRAKLRADVEEDGMNWMLSILAAVSFAVALVAKLPDEGSTASRRASLKAALHDEWEYQLRTYPELATSVGDNRYNDRLSDYSPQ